MKEINRNSNKEKWHDIGEELDSFLVKKTLMHDESSQLFHKDNKHMHEDDQFNVRILA